MHKRLRTLCAALLFIVLLFASCTQEIIPEQPIQRPAVQSGEAQFAQPEETATVAVLHTSLGDIYAVLFPEYTPKAVDNFLLLAEQGAYDDTLFHRVVRGFAVQGGDINGEGGHSAWGGTFGNEFTDRLHHYSGALSMAGAGPDTNGSQFFIVATAPGNLDAQALDTLLGADMREEVVDTYAQAGGAPYLDGAHTVFGQVFAGMEVVDAIASTPTDKNDKPRQGIVLEGVAILSYAEALPLLDAAQQEDDSSLSALSS